MTSYKQFQKLIQASRKGDVSSIKDLLSQNVDVNCMNQRNIFPLLVASQNGRKEAVQLLIERGAYVNMKGESQITALSLASECGHHETVQILLEKGAHVDQRVSDGRTPLMLASENGHEETVRVLLSKNANVNLYVRQKQTAFTYALSNEHSEVAKLLLPHVADINSRDSKGLTPLMLAARFGFADIAQLLLSKGAKVSLDLRSPQYGSTALILASEGGSVETVSILLKNGAQIDLLNNDGYTALTMASRKGHVDVVEVLLSHNTEVDLRHPATGETALIIASKNGHAEIVKLLLCDTVRKQSASQKVHVSEESDETMEIVENQEVPQEIDHSPPAEINTIDNEGQTALSVASSCGNLEIVETLVRHGADVNQSVGEESTLSRAVASRNAKVVSLLLQNKANVNYGDLVYASQHGLLDIVTLLIPHFESLNFQDTKSSSHVHGSNLNTSALWWAVRNGHASIVNLLLENGASVDNAVMSSGEVPALMIATMQENVEIVKALLNKGANVDVSHGQYSQQPMTPMMLAIYAGNKTMVRLLIEHGSNLRFKFTHTCMSQIKVEFNYLDLANLVGNEKIVSILKEAVTTCKPNSQFWTSSESCTGNKVDAVAAKNILSKIRNEFKCYVPCSEREFSYSVCPDDELSKIFLRDMHYSFAHVHDPRDSDDDSKNKPTVTDAFNMLLPVAASWKSIGVLLNINYGKLKNIEVDKKTSVLDTLLEMLDEWLKIVDPRPPTWDDLVEAVKKFDPSLAQQIQKKYCTV